jgi:hypothetical protein
LLTLDGDRVREGLKAGAQAVVEGAKSSFAAVKDAMMSVHKLGHQAFKDLMASKTFAVVMTVARFIPIPIVQVVVKIVDIARAAYSVYQGVKNGSIGAVLGGLASMAPGVGQMAGALGASASTVNTIVTAGKALSVASQAYSAVAQKDFSAAVGLVFGETAGRAASVVQSVKNGDTLGALSGVLGLAATGTASASLANAKDAVDGVRVVRALDQGHLEQAHSIAAGMGLAQDAAGVLNRKDGADQAVIKTLDTTGSELTELQTRGIDPLERVDLGGDLQKVPATLDLDLDTPSGADNRTLLNAAEGRYTGASNSLAGSSQVAKSGDSIARLMGTSDPQAIGAFMRANNLTSSTIQEGRTYFIPSDVQAQGDARALGQGALDADNAKAAARRAEQERAANQGLSATLGSAESHGTGTGDGGFFDEGAGRGTYRHDAVTSTYLPANISDSWFGVLTQQATGGLVGAGKSMANVVVGTAHLASNTILQIGDILTLGLNHNSELMQRVWTEQNNVGAGMVRLVTDPLEVLNSALQSAGQRIESAQLLRDQGKVFEAAVMDGELGADWGQAVIGGAQVVKAAGNGLVYAVDNALTGPAAGSRAAQLGAIHWPSGNPLTAEGRASSFAGAQLREDLIQRSTVVADTSQDASYIARTDKSVAVDNNFEWDHVLAGEPKNAGTSQSKGTGFHAESQANGAARIPEGAVITPLDGGTYKAPVQIWDELHGAWVDKVAQSTFFPKNWSLAKIEFEVTEAFKVGEAKGLARTSFKEYSPAGIEIQFHWDVTNQRTTFYPTGKEKP